MVLPPTLEPDSVYKTVSLARLALSNRLKNNDGRLKTSPAFYHGTPNPENLPNERLSIWLELVGINPDTDAPFGAELLLADWTIFVVHRDEGGNPRESDPEVGDRIMGAVFEMLSESLEDTSLDGAVEEINFTGGFHSLGSVSGGDNLVQSWQLNFQARHPMWPIRCPP